MAAKHALPRIITAFFAIGFMTGDVVGQTNRSVAEMHAGAGAGDSLSSRQVDLVEKVSAYFNQWSGLKGEFLQTSAGGNRLRGKFVVQRPGLFRFDYARPSRLLIVSDGKYVAVQDHDLKTDDRFELSHTPLGVLLRQDVNLLRDARFFEINETEETVVIAFEDKKQQSTGPLTLVLSKKPTLELKRWLAKDMQGRKTQIELSNIVRVDSLSVDLFKPSPMALDQFR